MASNIVNMLTSQCLSNRLKAACVLKQTVSGKLFQILTILHAKKFWRILLFHRVLYSLQTWPRILKYELSEKRL